MSYALPAIDAEDSRYVAPPLDGIWATAPFFHNGSLPSLAALLDSSIRPTTWSMSFGDGDFDPETVGWRIDGPEERYDSTAPGSSNQGHEYGDALAADERRALLEYLKSL